MAVGKPSRRALARLALEVEDPGVDASIPIDLPGVVRGPPQKRREWDSAAP